MITLKCVKVLAFIFLSNRKKVRFKTLSGPAAEKIKKQLQSLFKQEGLQIVIDHNLKVANYLDVTFNLNDGSYGPYRNDLMDITFTFSQITHHL